MYPAGGTGVLTYKGEYPCTPATSVPGTETRLDSTNGLKEINMSGLSFAGLQRVIRDLDDRGDSVAEQAFWRGCRGVNIEPLNALLSINRLM